MSSIKPLGDRCSEGKTNRQAHADLPAGTYERELGRSGFFGQATHMYHQHPPTGWIEFKGPLQPRAFDCNKILASLKKVEIKKTAVELTPFEATPLLYNKDLQLQFWNLQESMQSLVRNADGDWVLFLHSGSADLFCDYGHLHLVEGDYCVIPKGTLWRLEVDSPLEVLLIEASEARLCLPDKGLLGPHAFFDPALLDHPQINAEFQKQYSDSKTHVLVKRNQELSQITYPFNPLDAVGWHGDLMPCRINIRHFRPVNSHRYHLPPSVHSTFVAPNFVICTFVPRPFETDADAIKIPFFHNNDDYDEVIFYHKGDFFSRDHIEPGMITFHPAGFTHGPHPKALKNMLQQSKTATDEYAVMIDSRYPLKVASAAELVEDAGYVDSWKLK